MHPDTFGIKAIRWIEARFQRSICTAIWIPGAMPQARNKTAPLALNSSDGREKGEATQARNTFHCPNAGWRMHRTRGPRLHRESGPAGKACVRVRCA